MKIKEIPFLDLVDMRGIAEYKLKQSLEKHEKTNMQSYMDDARKWEEQKNLIQAEIEKRILSVTS